MSVPERDLELRRDQALRDLRELTEQVDRRELSPQVAAGLRRGYEQEAAAALAALERLSTAEGSGEQDAREAADMPPKEGAAGSRVGRRTLQPRYLLYGLGVLSAVAAGLVLPGYVLDRPGGGFVTGNEALQGSGGTGDSSESAPSAAKLEDVTNAELEAVVEANPDVLGMRLALADRYTAEGRYDLAAVHYSRVLEKDPGNSRAIARLGWLMLQLDEPEQAARLVDEALARDPDLPEALWYKANIRVYGFDDPQGAAEALKPLRERQDLAGQERDRIEELWQTVTDQLAEGTR